MQPTELWCCLRGLYTACGLYRCQKRYVTSYKDRGLPIGVSRLIDTFWTFGGLGRWYVVCTYWAYEVLVRLLFDHFCIFFLFSSGLACLSKFDFLTWLLLVYYDTCSLFYSISCSVHYFVLTPHCQGCCIQYIHVPIHDPVDFLINKINIYMIVLRKNIVKDKWLSFKKSINLMI